VNISGNLKQNLESRDEEVRLQGLKSLAPALEEDSSLLPLILEALGDDSWRVRKEAVEIFLSLSEAGNLARAIIELLHAQENAGLRNAAVEVLVRIGRQAIPYLIEELPSKDQDVRKFVLDILGEIGDPAAIPAMLPALGDSDGNVRTAAAENLGKLRATQAVPFLLQAMKGADLWFCFTVLEALGRIGTPLPLTALLEFSGQKLLRKALYECLGKVGGAEAGPFLLQGLKEEAASTRAAALLALADLAGRLDDQMSQVYSALSQSRLAQCLIQFLESKELPVRRAAVELMGKSSDHQFAFPLLNLLDDPDVSQEAGQALLALDSTAVRSLLSSWEDSDERVRTFMAFLVGETRCSEGFASLNSGLFSADAQLRMVSAQSLGKLGEERGVGLLAGRLEDPVEEVQAAAAKGLSRLAVSFTEEAVRVLKPMLWHEDPHVRKNVIGILGGLAGSEAKGALAMAVKDESPLVRRAAVQSLGRKGEGENIQVLMMGLTDEDTEVRRLSAEGMGCSGQKQAIAPLALALGDDDIWVRTTAVRALGQLGGDEAATLAEKTLSDSVGLVVISALETLVLLDRDRAFPGLLGALEHEDEEVVNAALKLLAAGGRKDWIPGVLDYLLNHRHWEVRNTFIRVLAELDGVRCKPCLEDRLRIETEPLVRQQIQELLTVIGEYQG
jgi:HEAT repeat protein